MIPLVNLKKQWKTIEREVNEGISRIISATSFILGKEVEEFEEAFARFSQVEFCVGVANGTDALELALRAIGVVEGDEVIVPTNSFIASALAVVRAGAKPVFVDCDPHYYFLDIEDTKKKIGARTRAIMPVHLYGQMAPLGKLQEVVAKRNIAIIEDAAQAQGSRQNGQAAGSIGMVSGTSFYPGKNLGAFGDGGAVLTRSAEIAKKVRALRNYGSETKYHHPELGFNSRLDTIQAAVLLAKLKHLEEWNNRRRQAAQRYQEMLVDLPGLILPKTFPGNEHIWHVYVIRVPHRDKVLRHLQQAGIGAGIHYPIPIHLQGAFAAFGYQKGDFPVAEKLSEEMLSLPLCSEITAEEQQLVVEELKKALA